MEKIAIIGAGLIGRSWAIVFARAGHDVALHDADPASLAANLAALETSLADLRSASLLSELPAAVRARIRIAETLEAALADAGYVQENIGESVEAKRAIFSRMDAMAGPATILASSTSTVPASAFSEALAGRARCLVAHPVNPPHLVPLVELSPAPWTSPDVLERARRLQVSVGQVPIIVKREIQGFILNRLQAALLAEAWRLYEDGYASAEDIDAAVREGLGLRWSFMGPFETIDLNAPGGLADYVARYGRVLNEINASQSPRRWSAESVARLDAERRRSLPATALAHRQAWRDRRLMALLAHKRSAAAK